MKITLHEISCMIYQMDLLTRTKREYLDIKVIWISDLRIRGNSYIRILIDAVVNTVVNNFPLNVMYWAVNGDRYEVFDGQQRSISAYADMSMMILLLNTSCSAILQKRRRIRFWTINCRYISVTVHRKSVLNGSR